MVLGKRYLLKMLAFRLTKSVFKSINQEMHVAGIFCDLVKAFDCVHHGSLLPKLHVYSI
jgi:hypothetical protein